MSQGVFRDQDLPLRDRRQGWKHEGQGAPRGRGASCCVSRFQLILFGRLTCSTLSGAPSPWRHDPDKFPDRLSRNARDIHITHYRYMIFSFSILDTMTRNRRDQIDFRVVRQCTCSRRLVTTVFKFFNKFRRIALSKLFRQKSNFLIFISL